MSQTNNGNGVSGAQISCPTPTQTTQTYACYVVEYFVLSLICSIFIYFSFSLRQTLAGSARVGPRLILMLQATFAFLISAMLAASWSKRQTLENFHSLLYVFSYTRKF